MLLHIAELVGAGIVGGLISALGNHYLTKSRERSAAISSERKQFIFEIDKIIETTKNVNVPNLVRPLFKKLFGFHLRFRPHIKARHLKAYEQAWNNLQGTTFEEVRGSTGSYEKSSPELKQIQQMIINRLEAVRRIVQNTK